MEEGQGLTLDQVIQVQRVLPILEDSLKEIPYLNAEFRRFRLQAAGGASAAPATGIAEVPMDDKRLRELTKLFESLNKQTAAVESRLKVLETAQADVKAATARLADLDSRVAKLAGHVAKHVVPQLRTFYCRKCRATRKADPADKFCTVCGTTLTEPPA
jgi:rubrerythrin